MNNMDSSSKKTWIISLLIIAAATLAYFTFFSEPDPNLYATLEGTQESNLVGAQVLSMLNQIRSLDIDSEFFKSSAYTSLNDYSVQVPPQNVGRPNPFAPVPGIRSTTQPARR